MTGTNLSAVRYCSLPLLAERRILQSGRLNPNVNVRSHHVIHNFKVQIASFPSPFLEAQIRVIDFTPSRFAQSFQRISGS